MNAFLKPAIAVLVLPASALLPAAALAEEPQCFYESRSGVNVECGIYHSEISNTRAFLETIVKRGKWTDPQLRPVILDVRSTPEYKAGHPEHAYNAPYPYIYQSCKDVGPDGTTSTADGLTENDRTPDGACIKSNTTTSQLPADFVSYVEKIVPNKDTPIYTMCRTGVRSVGAANRLTEAGYTNVRNMWEGFVGVNLKAPQVVGYEPDDGDPNTPLVPIIADAPVDLNHDGQLTDADKNGWLYHLALPYDTRLLPKLKYKNPLYPDIYSWD